ncbi:unnamed protein product [Gongylonema pulchrum]|uniref:RRM domain-containing protein n=1 Tax=Gongylonema pulchrum TaxID=637853 RepID=A0A183EVT9_9BILA|nr:unnamed protein product [Gongylonema pulchrum]
MKSVEKGEKNQDFCELSGIFEQSREFQVVVWDLITNGCFSLFQVFRACPGFTRLRLHTKGGSTVAFAEFSDVRQATIAMSQLQGAHIASSDRGGIRIEYAKNKMSDVNGPMCVAYPSF